MGLPVASAGLEGYFSIAVSLNIRGQACYGATSLSEAAEFAIRRRKVGYRTLKYGFKSTPCVSRNRLKRLRLRKSSALVIVADNDTASSPNLVDSSEFFVRQHDRDFLDRDPNFSELAF